MSKAAKEYAKASGWHAADRHDLRVVLGVRALRRHLTETLVRSPHA